MEMSCFSCFGAQELVFSKFKPFSPKFLARTHFLFPTSLELFPTIGNLLPEFLSVVLNDVDCE
uniref:Uncharacterized protein n=1 Tax=Helianthus annuus TaxID=4232 RepID=A0A251SFC3_HELAN